MILRLAHAEIGVTDLEQARLFYVDLLGFTLYQQEPESCTCAPARSSEVNYGDSH